MKKWVAMSIFAVIGPVVLGGCSHTVNGRPFTNAHGVTVETFPAGATVTNAFGNSCVSPCDISLPTDVGGEVTVALDGYLTETLYIGSHTNSRRAITSSALNAIDPDPVDLALDSFLLLFNRNGLHRELDAYDVQLTMVPMDAQNQRPESTETPEASASNVTVNGDENTVIYRLTEEEISAIRARY